MLPKMSLSAFCFRVLKLDMGKFHQGLCDTIEDNRMCVVMAPRQHGKTEICTIAQALWRAYYGNKGDLIMMVSSVADQASAVMDRFRHHIETNPVLKEQLMPENTYKEKWGSTIVSCRNGVTVRSSGLSSKIRGHPVNHMMLDDVLRDDIGSTGKTKKLFFEVVMPTVSATKGTLSVVGTPQSFIDLLHELMDAEGNGFNKSKFSAVVLDDAGEWDYPLWPQRYSLEELERVRNTVGSVAWSKEYMCFGRDTFVHTPNGLKPIQDIYVGDEVLSATFNKRKVLSKFKRKIPNYYSVKLNKYSLPIKVSDNHPWYVLNEVSSKSKYLVVTETKNLKKGDKIVMPYKDGDEDDDFDLANIYGWYLAEGSIGSKNKSVVFYMASHETEHIKSLENSLKDLGFNPKRYKYKDKSVTPVTVNSKLLVDKLIRLFGRAKGKHIDYSIHSKNYCFKNKMLKAYLDGDGSETPNGYECSSVCLDLSEGIARLAETVGFSVSREYNLKHSARSIIDGREIVGNGIYHRLRLYTNSRVTKRVNGLIINKVKSVEFIESPLDVFNIEVDIENNYLVGNAAVHNCKPVSGGSSLFPYDLIQKSIKKSLGRSVTAVPDFSYYLACDIALSSKGGADYSVFMVGEREKEGAPLKVVKILRFKGKPLDEQASIVNDLNDRFHFRKIFVEQAGLGYDFPNKLIHNYSNLSNCVVPFKTTRKEKERILGGLEIAFRNSALLIPNNDVLVEELLAFGVKLREDGHGGFTQSYEALAGHDDCVMSLAMLVDAGASVHATHTIQMV